MIVGVTTGKNSLGALCMVGFLFCLWRLLNREPQTSRLNLLSDMLVGATAGWFLLVIDSLTSLVLTVVGTMVILAGKWSNHTRGLVRTIAIGSTIVVMIATPALVVYGQRPTHEIDQLAGHEETFWGRVSFWPELATLSEGSPLTGVGFGSYWLGPRLRALWSRYGWQPTEAHNGYVETYLELGFVGVGVLGWFILGAVRSASREFAVERSRWSPLRLAYVTAASAYNITEAAFKGLHLVWLIMLIMGCSDSDRAEQSAIVAMPKTHENICPHQTLAPVRHRTALRLSRSLVPSHRTGATRHSDNGPAPPRV
jgi:O-antigen ligase